MVDAHNWNITKQILTDLVLSKDGRPQAAKNIRSTQTSPDGSITPLDRQFVKIFFMGGADFVYPSYFPKTVLEKGEDRAEQNAISMDNTVPRFGIGAFLHGWIETFKFHYGFEPEVEKYGKPYLTHMKFIEDYVLQRHK